MSLSFGMDNDVFVHIEGNLDRDDIRRNRNSNIDIAHHYNSM